MKQIVFTILAVSFLTGCDLITNSFTYKDKTKALVETMLKEDYARCIDHFAMEHQTAKTTNVEEMKKGIAVFRDQFVENFGTELDYRFMSATKHWSTEESKSSQPNTTVVQIEFSNDKEFGVFKVVFDDVSGKILNINTLEIKEPIPSMTIFWLFGLMAICVPVFNIWVIVQIKRSSLRKKWLKYMAVTFLNVPAITYAAVGSSLSLKLLNFQILFGLSFGFMGYSGSYWTFGIPLGGLYWLWRLKFRKSIVAKSETPVEWKGEDSSVLDYGNPPAQ